MLHVTVFYYFPQLANFREVFVVIMFSITKLYQVFRYQYVVIHELNNTFNQIELYNIFNVFLNMDIIAM